MNVHNHTRLESGKYFQEQIENVTANLYHVRRVDEENVPRAQLFKSTHFDFLDFLSNQPGKARKSPSYHFVGIRLNRYHVRIAIHQGGLSSNSRRKPGP